MGALSSGQVQQWLLPESDQMVNPFLTGLGKKAVTLKMVHHFSWLVPRWRGDPVCILANYYDRVEIQARSIREQCC